MDDRKELNQKARDFFEQVWSEGDLWSLETSDFERSKYMRQLELIQGRRYARVLEIGCGAGVFTRHLASLADRIVALDISNAAIKRAQAVEGVRKQIEFRVANIMDYDPRVEGPWDLIVMSETVYYLGWLYPFFDLAWLASQLFEGTADGGQLLMANTFAGVEEDYLLRPWLIRTYRDLFLNIGYAIRSEEVFRGTKNGAELDVLISLFIKPSHRSSVRTITTRSEGPTDPGPLGTRVQTTLPSLTPPSPCGSPVSLRIRLRTREHCFVPWLEPDLDSRRGSCSWPKCRGFRGQRCQKRRDNECFLAALA